MTHGLYIMSYCEKYLVRKITQIFNKSKISIYQPLSELSS